MRKRRQIVLLVLLAGISIPFVYVYGKPILFPPPPPGPTLENFLRLCEGMTEQQASDILGVPTGHTEPRYELWHGEGCVIYASFEPDEGRWSTIIRKLGLHREHWRLRNAMLKSNDGSVWEVVPGVDPFLDRLVPEFPFVPQP